MPKHYYILPMAIPSKEGLNLSGNILKPVENGDFIENLRQIRNHYEKEAKISKPNLSSSPNSLGMFFGYQKNLSERFPQIEFLEIWLAHFEQKNEGKSYSREDLCILVAAACFIRHTIKASTKVVNHSVLYRLLGSALGLAKDNIIDPHTQYCLYQITNKFIHPDKTQGTDAAGEPYKGLFKDASSECKAISEAFTSYIAKQRQKCQKPDEESVRQNTYPITIALSKVVGDCAAVAGWSAGAVAGDFLAKTTGAMPVKAALTAGIGSAVCLLTGAGPTVAIALAAPTVASKLISTFSSVSMAYLLGGVMKILGNVAGAAAGFPLDLSVHLAYNGANKMYELITGTPLANISGMRLVDGQQMLCGIEFTILENSGDKHTYSDTSVETITLHTENGVLDAKVNGETISPDFVAELKDKLKELEENKNTNQAPLEKSCNTPVGSF